MLTCPPVFLRESSQYQLPLGVVLYVTVCATQRSKMYHVLAWFSAAAMCQLLIAHCMADVMQYVCRH